MSARSSDRMEELRRALNLAVGMVMEHEPGDSRAVSPEAVALAAVVCECDDEKCWAVIDAALSVRMKKVLKAFKDSSFQESVT